MTTLNTAITIARAITDHSGDTEGYRELLENVRDNLSDDFNIDFGGREYRIIGNDCIEDIMKDELSSDEYVLGCFASWVIADALNIPVSAVEKIQQADAHEALGILINNNEDALQSCVDALISHDGAGHHFSSYDGSENDTGDYTVFCID